MLLGPWEPKTIRYTETEAFLTFLVFLKQGDSFSIFYHYYWWHIEFRVNKPASLPPSLCVEMEDLEFHDVDTMVLDLSTQPETVTIVDSSEGSPLKLNEDLQLWLDFLPEAEREAERKQLEAQMKQSL